MCPRALRRGNRTDERNENGTVKKLYKNEEENKTCKKKQAEHLRRLARTKVVSQAGALRKVPVAPVSRVAAKKVKASRAAPRTAANCRVVGRRVGASM
jgi:hypothetical protein